MNKVKPSVLIEDALSALKQCEADAKYDINMNDWHVMGINGICRVCLAGAVMAKRLSGNILGHEKLDGSIVPICFGPDIDHLLVSLDDFRKGRIVDGLACLGININNYQLPKWLWITDYHDSREKFYDDMELLVDVLKDEGL